MRFVVPCTPGGSVDTRGARFGAEAHRADRWIVRGGRSLSAAGVIGAELVVKAPPNGHTLLASSTEFAINPAIRVKLPYDPLRDFAHVMQMANVQFILAGHPRRQ